MKIEFDIPAYLTTELDLNKHIILTTDESKMNLVHKITYHNIVSGTGGPFGAAIFRKSELISLGVNLVINQQIACFHAETIAIILANKQIKNYDLSTLGEIDLYTSSFPCGMCLGAIIWSGIRRIVYSTSNDKVEKHTGFDEGIKAKNMKQQLLKRGIEINGPVLEEAGIDLLNLYMMNKGSVYNAANNFFNK